MALFSRIVTIARRTVMCWACAKEHSTSTLKRPFFKSSGVWSGGAGPDSFTASRTQAKTPELCFSHLNTSSADESLRGSAFAFWSNTWARAKRTDASSRIVSPRRNMQPSSSPRSRHTNAHMCLRVPSTTGGLVASYCFFGFFTLFVVGIVSPPPAHPSPQPPPFPVSILNIPPPLPLPSLLAPSVATEDAPTAFPSSPMGRAGTGASWSLLPSPTAASLSSATGFFATGRPSQSVLGFSSLAFLASAHALALASSSSFPFCAASAASSAAVPFTFTSADGKPSLAAPLVAPLEAAGG
mmetsp:Transcript_66427/g.133842  ORF Transcript_66427/g.133842 Transcript_66427/m.133842 type:complete len:298 (-) Transcript_66427:318-1211(-)